MDGQARNALMIGFEHEKAVVVALERHFLITPDNDDGNELNDEKERDKKPPGEGPFGGARHKNTLYRRQCKEHEQHDERDRRIAESDKNAGVEVEEDEIYERGALEELLAAHEEPYADDLHENDEVRHDRSERVAKKR